MNNNFKKKAAALVVATTMATSIGLNLEDVSASEKKSSGLIPEENELEFSYTSEEFEDKEEAKEWLEEVTEKLDDEYEIVSSEIIEIEDQVISTEEKQINETFKTEEEAIKMKEEIEKQDVEDVNLTIEKNTYEETITINETFKTEEEALDFITKYKQENNIDLETETIYSNWISSGKIKVTELSGLTEAERDQKAQQIKTEIEKDNTDIVRYEVFVEKTSTTENVYIKDNITNDTKQFNTIEDANKYIKDLKLSETDNIKIEVTGPIKKEELVSSNSFKIEEKFDTNAQVEEFLNKLKEQGYILENIKTSTIKVNETIKVPTENIIVNNSNKLDSANKYEVKANYVMIKQSSGKVAVWTPEQLTEKEQTSFKNAWLNGNYDPSVGNDFEFYFISGEGDKDLSYIGKQWGVYNFKLSDDKIIMTCDKDRISHLNYGTIQQEYKEQIIEKDKILVEGNKIQKVYKDIYEVSYEKKEKIFEKVPRYGAIINKEKFTRDQKYNVTGEGLVERSTWTLKGNYKENEIDSVYIVELTAYDKDLIIEDYDKDEENVKDPSITNDKDEVNIKDPSTTNDKNEDSIKDPSTTNDKDEDSIKTSQAKENAEKYADDTPKTGDDSNLELALASMAASTALAGVALQRKRKKN